MRHTAAAAIMATVAALGVTACGSSSTQSSSTPANTGAAGSSGASTTASSPAPKGSPIVIGYGVSQTGALASSVQSSGPAAEAWEQSVNAAGGINGHPVKIIVGDTQGSAAAATALMHKFVQQDHVAAVMISDPVAEGAVGAYLNSQKIPVIGASGYLATEWNGLPSFFATTQNSDSVTVSEGVAAVSAGYKNVGVASCNATSTCAGDGPPVKAAVEKAGGTYTGLVEVADGAPSYTAQCLDFMHANTDAIVLVVDPATSVQLMQACIQQGYKGVFTSGATSFTPSGFSSVTGAKLVGSLNAFPWWVDSPEVNAFRAAMTKYEPKVSYATTAATSVWSSLQLFKQVASGVTGSVTAASVMKGYDAVKNETVSGLMPQPLKFTAGKPSPVINCFWQFKYSVGDTNPTLVAPTGSSGNGTDGDLATACLKQ